MVPGLNLDWNSRNVIINGGMEFSERYGIVAQNIPSTNEEYFLDRWKLAYDGPFTSATVTQSTFVPTRNIGVQNSMLINSQPVNAGSEMRIVHHIESAVVQDLIDTRCSISFWMYHDGWDNYSVEVRNKNVLDGPGASLIYSNGGTTTVPGVWYRYSLHNINLGIVQNGLEITITLSNPNNFAAFDTFITGVSMGPGTQPVSYVRAGVDVNSELLLTKRYYNFFTSPSLQLNWNRYNNGNINSDIVYFPTPMRTIPTISVADNVGNGGRVTAAPADATGVNVGATNNIIPPASTTVTNRYFQYSAGGMTIPGEAPMELNGIMIFRLVTNAEIEP